MEILESATASSHLVARMVDRVFWVNQPGAPHHLMVMLSGPAFVMLPPNYSRGLDVEIMRVVKRLIEPPSQ